jgi:hypothetical protein
MDEPRSAWSRRRSGASAENVEFTGLAQILGHLRPLLRIFS